MSLYCIVSTSIPFARRALWNFYRKHVYFLPLRILGGFAKTGVTCVARIWIISVIYEYIIIVPGNLLRSADTHARIHICYIIDICGLNARINKSRRRENGEAFSPSLFLMSLCVLIGRVRYRRHPRVTHWSNGPFENVRSFQIYSIHFFFLHTVAYECDRIKISMIEIIFGECYDDFLIFVSIKIGIRQERMCLLNFLIAAHMKRSFF
jgi:hypothetical protein